MINLDPNRKKTHKVIDLIYDDSCYIGSEEDCLEYVEEQVRFSDLAKYTYKIMPI